MSPDAFAPWLLIAKIALYAGALLAIGFGLHAALGIVEGTGRRRASIAPTICAGAALLAAILRMVLTSAELGSPLDPMNLSLVWQTQGSAVMALGAGAAAFTSAAIYRLSGVTVLASLAMAASFALTGHAQGVTAPLLTPIAVAAHVVCAGFWIAAPITLWPSSAIADDLLAARARRFSSLALAFVTVLFVLGGALALRLSGSVNALISSFYGQLLVAKLATATGALGLGAYNKMVVTNALETNPIRGRSMLMRALLADGLLFAAALLLVGWATTMTGPPDAV